MTIHSSVQPSPFSALARTTPATEKSASAAEAAMKSAAPSAGPSTPSLPTGLVGRNVDTTA